MVTLSKIEDAAKTLEIHLSGSRLGGYMFITRALLPLTVKINWKGFILQVKTLIAHLSNTGVLLLFVLKKVRPNVCVWALESAFTLIVHLLTILETFKKVTHNPSKPSSVKDGLSFTEDRNIRR